MFTFLLVVQAVVAALLVTLVLMQRSEGGGLGVGGSSSGLMTARGQADFLTRATTFTAFAFVGLSILLAGIATQRQSDTGIDDSLLPTAESTAPIAPAGGEAPVTDSVDSDILSTIAGQAESSSADEEAAPAE
ncbi:preprotein translocase subunit SecG [Parasphingopyxis lamellibrachiae]|uniref:Protein-export membrane protein SecG n=1 Tax=Parasphingopyxis lamellibrachiae TaxID=680125 RepID=A0A3D9FC82_9SPHN|nr:preprotein translocase subunit SecG [Parasphingopyxis lamellibrachiae]RED15404.1 protein translocase subunit secG [Parasphingopyxis lamellibrachiae]